MTKKESSKKGWTIMDKFKENNHPTCKNKLFKHKHYEYHQKTNIINQQCKYTKIILKTKIKILKF